MNGLNASANAGRKYAQRRLTAEACETCRSTEDLEVHHKDRNPQNNAPENAQTLCSPCHRKLHIAAGDWGKGRVKLATCEICRATFQPKRSRRTTLCGKPECLAEKGRLSAEKRWQG